MIQDIAYLVVFGLPLVVVAGIATLLGFAGTAAIALAHRRGIKQASFTLHYRFAIFSLALGVFHAALALSVYYGF
ncbi:hypothetical protein L1S32_01490 [Methanogenium sp. S4BF]|uniref:hypothetical protein n=1 Tax=Methanogenium sp. S4BF TaxID=1789226 RepID=UPI002417DD9D|nr:hypothetical protein [Methanogenium sp. S4BF]WFN34821.1 hypothetical protein L1S32_01490 [Methanogenium sp. S4BF]